MTEIDLTQAEKGSWFATEGGGVAEVVEEDRVTHRYWRLGLMGSTLNDNDGWQSHARDGRCLHRLIAFYDLTHALPAAEAERRRDVLAKLYERHQVVIGPDCRVVWEDGVRTDGYTCWVEDRVDGEWRQRNGVKSIAPEPARGESVEPAGLTEADVGTWREMSIDGELKPRRLTSENSGNENYVVYESPDGRRFSTHKRKWSQARRLTAAECRERGLPLKGGLLTTDAPRDKAEFDALVAKIESNMEAPRAARDWMDNQKADAPEPTEHERLAAFFFQPRDPGANILAEMTPAVKPYFRKYNGTVYRADNSQDSVQIFAEDSSAKIRRHEKEKGGA